ncbi:aminophospholipid-translocating P4-type ATPase DNF1 Ecym_5564 [Eremothecium cymbalariae DBVPG|uniref:Phospholipid-transporting ATPase n=1 Tax=Eremothecium cymbalariae (strain CBS 270.75 / DBVPG 7215 / KCTC 17166 / NRRL Y-17582) TaxID=931890 RepID=I6NE11_ERECY|nr:hypothetical protein Ecym_5564 [Eremothecium cymbalariae DBVPG\
MTQGAEGSKEGKKRNGTGSVSHGHSHSYSTDSGGTVTVPVIQVRDDQPLDSPFSDQFRFEIPCMVPMAEGGMTTGQQDNFQARKPSILKRHTSSTKGGKVDVQRLAFAPSTPVKNGYSESELESDVNSFTNTPGRNTQGQFGSTMDAGIQEEEEERFGKGAEKLTLERDPHLTRDMKVLRWGTQRHKNTGHPIKGRVRTLRWSRKNQENPYRNNSTNNKSNNNDNNNNNNNNEVLEEGATASRQGEKRTVFYNTTLPDEMLDENGRPVVRYVRNKIRTTKYTPLSFFPKNLMYQFKNVANVYFLVLIILSCVSIFGVTNPALASIPLIVIIIVTAIKDAVEDSRRTILDLEVNNTRTHILSGVENHNVSEDNVSLWRKFKKLNTRILFSTVRLFTERLTEKGRRKRAQRKREASHMAAMRAGGTGPRNSLDSIGSYRPSLDTERMDQSNPVDSGSLLNRNVPPKPEARFSRAHWKNVKVGDIVRIQNNDEVPADIILLATSDSDGACYVETKNLDGETNLKVRQSLKCSYKIRNSQDISKCNFWVESEGPHPNLYSYQGNLKWIDTTSDTVKNEPVIINNMLLRGCFLRNTKWATGIVMFTGNDTKIMLNAGITPTKKSRISRELNYSVMMNFALLFVLCLVAGVVNGLYYRYTDRSRSYFEFGTVAGSPFANSVLSFFVAVISYQSLVPISLYISIEIIKTVQAAFIYCDVLSYYKKLDYPCTPTTWNISDDLGQIEYIFSDKTGTLTQNVMEFKKCTINGISYGRAYTEALAGLRKRQGIDVEEESAREHAEIAQDKQEMIDILVRLGKNSQLHPCEVTFVSKELVEDLNGKSGLEQKEANEHFMLALALCHSVVAEQSKSNPERLELKAQSPDESALVGTARDMGFSFVGRTKSGVILEIQGVHKEFEILNVLEFNSARKRMSCIVKIPAESPEQKPKALLLCKGADSVIYSRLDRSNNDSSLLERTALHLEQYATEGLRTLCIAQRELSWDEYEDWNTRHEVAAASLTNREEQMEEVADSIERGLILLGGTAIEDRLQDGVPASIAILAEAGIKLWVLTGDKIETAINIGFSCNLLGNDMELLVIKSSGNDVQSMGVTPVEIVTNLIDQYLNEKFQMTGSEDELQMARGIHDVPLDTFGVVIDGDALKVALAGEDTRRKFLLLCKNCRAVLCCRVSPAQKAAVVRLVKDTLDVMTLAIGDGSNDVAMIQAADVGVGIAGEEGRQAVMSSDYAIGQFRFLTRLVLVHGRWSYKRLAEMIPQFFYKNIIFTLASFWFGIYSDYDGSYLYEYTYLMFYNLAFTSLPVILLGILDQDVNDTISVAVPQLYRVGILRTEWNQKKFWWYCLDGIYQSVICFFFPYFCFHYTGLVTKNGYGLDHRYWFGIFVTCMAVLSCNFYVFLHQYRWDWFSTTFVVLSCLVVFLWTFIWSSVLYSGEFYKSAFRVFGQPVFWAVLFIGVLFCLLPRFTFDVFRKLFFPRDIDIIRECWARGQFRNYPEGYDPTDPERKRLNAVNPHESYNNDSTAEKMSSMDQPLVLASQDIPMSLMDKSSSLPRTHATPVEGSTSPPRSSLEATRLSMLHSNQLDHRYSAERTRPSLDIPGLTHAETLIGRH